MVKLTITSLLLLSSILLFLCPLSKSDDGPIKLHVFLHSHMDLGWIYTFERYYQGSGGDDGGSVKNIFNNVYSSLLKDINRKYQVAEVGFLNRWWADQDDSRKEQFKKFVQQKQIQFVNGGWGTNDEACAYYDDIIDQFILGNRWLKEHFDVYPNVGWHIDSFGHSEAQASIFAQAGYDGFFYGRLDHQDWEKRRAEKSLEVLWKPQNPHNESVFGHALYYHYSDTKFMVPDNYFCRSIFCHGNLSENDLNKVTNWVKNQAKSFDTNNVAILVGDDFHLWKEAEKDFVGIENMTNYYKMNPNVGIQAKFSTLTEYVAEVKEDLKANGRAFSLPEKKGDFFPYIENSWTSWVGYFTSKSIFKLKVRKMSQYYNAAKLLFSKYMLGADSEVFTFSNDKHASINKALDGLEQALAIAQHHDAVSGTMKENVREDYENMLNKGWNEVDKEARAILDSYAQKLVGDLSSNYATIDFDWRENDKELDRIVGSKRSVLASVFNPGEKDKFLIKIKIPSYQYKVADESNNFLTVDIICNNDNVSQDCFAYFVDEVPAYSLKSYILSPSKLSKRVMPTDIKENVKLNINNQVSLDIDQNLQDFHYKLCSQVDIHNLEDIFAERKCVEDSFNLNYEYYESFVGLSQSSQVSSGAYVFRPRSNNKLQYSKIVSGRVYQGRVVTIVQIKRDNVRTDIKLVHHELDKGLEIESYLEPIDQAPSGKEVVMMLRSKNVLNQDKEFYTDSNGYYMTKRKIDHRDDFTTSNPDIKIPSNYYPITSAVYIESSETKQRMTVGTDRAQGTTSLNPGEIEIMIHRVCVADDWKGLGEVLNEKDPENRGHGIKVATRHYLMYSLPSKEIKSMQRKKQYQLDRPLQFWFKNIENDEFIAAKKTPQTKTLKLAEGVKLFVRSYKPNEYIVRLHNLDEQNSKNVALFNSENKQDNILNGLAGRSDIKIGSVTELSLFTTKNKADVKLNDLDPAFTNPINKNNDKPDLSSIELLPMEIRTFSILLN